jgi:hypothetical protein
MWTQLWNHFERKLHHRPRCRRSLLNSGRLEQLESRALLAAQVSTAAPIAEQTPSNAEDATPTVTQPPESVRRLRSVQLDSSSVMLRWSGADGASEIVIKRGRTEIARLDGDMSSYLVNGLIKGANYQFSVTATNDGGSKSASLRVRMRSLDLPTLDDFSLDFDRRGRLLLQLDSPWGESGILLRVQYRAAGSTGSYRTETIRPGSNSVALNRSLAGQRLEILFSSIPLGNSANEYRTEPPLAVTAPRG